MSSDSAKTNCRIQITKNGPYLVYGNVPLIKATIQCDRHGIPLKWVIEEKTFPGKVYSLCRCGQSKNKPFCDGTHVRAGFNGEETSVQSYENQATEIDGPALKLLDIEILCASARFCHRGGDIWRVIPKSDESKWKQNAVENSCDCPSGRLTVVDKQTGEKVEPTLEKSIGLICDAGMGIDGPLWVRGGIPVFSASGKPYQVRNRMTLCRCGKSSNKPFCDSSHYPQEEREER
jgi:CDGSH-type Zn-finger protein